MEFRITEELMAELLRKAQQTYVLHFDKWLRDTLYQLRDAQTQLDKGPG